MCEFMVYGLCVHCSANCRAITSCTGTEMLEERRVLVGHCTRKSGLGLASQLNCGECLKMRQLLLFVISAYSSRHDFISFSETNSNTSLEHSVACVL